MPAEDFSGKGEVADGVEVDGEIASGVVFDRAGAAVEIKAHRHGAAKVKDEDDPID